MSFMNWMEKKLVPVANKINNNRYISAVKNGMISTIPVTIAGSLFLVLAFLPIPGWNDMITNTFGSLDMVLIPFLVTMNVLGIYVTVLIAHNLAEHYKLDTKGSTALSIAAYFMTLVGPLVKAGTWATTKGTIAFGSMGAVTIFGGILIAILVVELQRFCHVKNIGFKFPESVPKNISASFNVIVPITIVLLTFWVFTGILGLDLHKLLNDLFKPLTSFLAGNNIFGPILTIFLVCLLWTFGIHGSALIMNLVSPILLQNLQANQEALKLGQEIPNIVAGSFYDVYGQIGGSGATLGFLFAVFLVARKQKQLMTIASVSTIPGVFNINEPITFGVPIVMNPIMMIPFILGPIVTVSIGFLATWSGLVGRIIAPPPWTTPNILMGYISTLDWKSIVLALVIYVVLTIIWIPFVRIYSKVLDSEAQTKKAATK